MRNYDWIIVGAGLTGSVLAERIASQCDQSVLLIDKRPHLGGNCYDYPGEHGVLIHKYGPHIFHTNSSRIWQYLSKFTSWRPYFHRSLGHIDGNLLEIPFNINSLYTVFPHYLADNISKILIDYYGYGKSVDITTLLSNENDEIKFLSNYIFDKVYKNYVLKKWGFPPESLDRSATSRLPILISKDNRYFQDRYQAMPSDGYAILFKRMTEHSKISISLSTNYIDILEYSNKSRIIFTGKIDEFFRYSRGPLPYRSVDIILREEPTPILQPVGSINFPNEFDLIRITELKHLTGGNGQGTILMEEYPSAHEPGLNEPCYPIPRAETAELANAYRRDAEQLAGKIWFAGRLGDYAYYNMDQAVGRALSLFEKKIVPAIRS